MKINIFLFICMLLQLYSLEEVYLHPRNFILQSFNGKIPKSSIIKITPKINNQIEKLFGHGYLSKRVRYWQEGKRQALILEEIGKTLVITIGIIIEQKSIVSLEVLIYRESHGSEVKSKSFQQQFENLKLINNQLTKSINNIAGSTLSVQALTYIAKVALYLNKLIK